MKYMRTNIFKQSNFGDAFIRPLFYDYPEDVQAYNEVENQYMYGPAIKVSITY